jgi:programmed cell death protein 5
VQRVALVKPEKARRVEEFLLRQHAKKPPADKIPESVIIRLLESVSGQEEEPKVTVVRKGRGFEEDDGFDEADF